MNKQNLIIIILVLIILAGAIFISYLFIKDWNNKIYIQGVSQGAYDVINKINSEGTIPVLTTTNNQTTIKYTSISQICQGIKQ